MEQERSKRVPAVSRQSGHAGRSPECEGGEKRLGQRRDSAVWQRLLYSQIWRDPPVRADSPQALPQPDYVPGSHVLGGRRERQRGRHVGRRWRPVGNLICGDFACRIFLLSVLLITGCRHSSEADWQRRYSDAQSKFRFGYTKEALQLADAAYQASLKTDPIWNWRFRILKAQISLRQNAPDQAINILASEPPP